jgi:hypothetical protein
LTWRHGQKSHLTFHILTYSRARIFVNLLLEYVVVVGYYGSNTLELIDCEVNTLRHQSPDYGTHESCYQNRIDAMVPTVDTTFNQVQ